MKIGTPADVTDFIARRIRLHAPISLRRYNV